MSTSKPSETQDHYKDYETKSEPTETSAQMSSSTQSAEARKRSRKMEEGELEGQDKKRKVEQVPDRIINEDSNTAFMEHSSAEGVPRLDALTVLHLILEDLIDLEMGCVDLKMSMSEGRSEALGWLNHGASAYERFERTGKVQDVDRAIECWGVAVAILPDSHQGRWGALNNLGCAYDGRFELLGELSDRNNAIERKMEAVSLTPDGHPGKPLYLGNLGSSYLVRFLHLGGLSDLDKAIEYQAKAVSLTLDGQPHRPACLCNLGTSYEIRFKRLGELSDLNKAIEYQARAVSLTPAGHWGKPVALNGLGKSYETRFKRLGELSDLNKAIELGEEAVLLTPDSRPGKAVFLCSLGKSYATRFRHLGERSDLEKAIEHKVNAVSLIPFSQPDKPAYLEELAISYQARFELLGKPQGDPSDLNTAIEYQTQARSLTPNNHSDKPGCLCNLGNSYAARFECLGELSDLNNAIECQVEAVSLILNNNPHRPEALHNLGNSYLSRFKLLEELSDLNKAIECKSEAVRLTPDGHPDKPEYLGSLGGAFQTRFLNLSDISDLKSAISSFRAASQSTAGPPSVRFRACRHWAQLSQSDTTSDPHPAYHQAMQLLPQLVWIGTTIGRRYELVAEINGFATEASSHAISIGAYHLALEWLEAGRSVVWGQIAQLRTPFEDLFRHNPGLAEELASIGRRLELEHTGAQSYIPSSSSLCTEPSARDLSQEANARVHVALEWDRLLSYVRSMSGFENFLCPPSASRLLETAKSQAVAIINLHESRCDALVLQPGSDIVSHIPLVQFSLENVASAREHLLYHVRGRKPGPRLKQSDPLEGSVENLWSGMVKPVLDFLGYTEKLSVDQLPHLTWCTTGLLSFLPIHAARSHDKSQPSAFELVISSYTPTLTSLLSSQSADQSANCGILAVGQELTPGLTPLPCTTRELAVIHERAGSDCYLQLENDEATVEQVLDAMEQFSWVHLACHGSQYAGDPTGSAFHLHDGNLTLGAITKCSFKNKGLAFLSACQTAAGDQSIPDEAVHLAAGMLMAGYPSVIGTMWSIADEDGPEVADRVYAELLKDGKMDHTKSARALHKAISYLREKVGKENIARWAPFIHIGS